MSITIIPDCKCKPVVAELVAALQKIIDMNVQYCIDKYGDAGRAESMGCVVTAREAIAKASPC